MRFTEQLSQVFPEGLEMPSHSRHHWTVKGNEVLRAGCHMAYARDEVAAQLICGAMNFADALQDRATRKAIIR